MSDLNPLDPIPSPPRTRYVGNMFSLRAAAPIQDMMAFAKELGPIYWLDMMGKPIVVVSGADLVEELSDETRFDKAVRGALRRIRAFAGDGLFTAYTEEPNWSKAHNILLPNFSQKAMLGYHPMMVDVATQMVEKWGRLNADEEIDVVHDMTAMTLDTIGLAGFDYRFNSFYRRDNHPFVEAMVRALDATMRTRGLPLEDIIRKDREMKLKSDIKYMNKVVDRIIQERRAHPELAKDKKDLLSYMMSGVDKKSGERLDDLQMRYQVITFLIAGHETTSGLLSFVIYYLLQNPEIMAKAVAEVDRVLGPNLAHAPTPAQVTQLEYVTKILKEALRLWPTAPAYAVAPHKDVEVIGGKYEIKKSYQTVVLIPSLHKDKKVWGERAEVFDPENHTREAEARRPSGAYKPFGNGQRACIGRQFAMQEAALLIGMILQRFELIDHHRYALKVKETLSVKPDEFFMKIRPRPGRENQPGMRPFVASTESAAPVRAANPNRPTHNTPLLVLYGSNLGAAEGIARQIADAGDSNGFNVTTAPLDDYAGRLPTEGAVAIVSASYNGAPPDNAQKFCDWLDKGSLAPTALKGVRYVVFGCGNRDWSATFQTVPRMLDTKLAGFGAHRITARGEGDARDDFDGQFQAWFSPLFGTVAKDLGVEIAPVTAERQDQYAVEVISEKEVSPFVGSLGAATTPILVNRELHTKSGAEPSPRSTRHIEVQLPAGAYYRAGDHLGVIAHNSAALIRRVADRFDIAPEARIKLHAAGGRKGVLPVDQPIQVSRLLGDYVELQDVASRKHITVMAAHTRCPHTGPKLRALSGDDEASQAKYRAEVFNKRKSVIDLLEEFRACELPFNVYLEMLPPLRPRYYSISSSPLVSPSACAISVAIVNEPHRSGTGTFEGVCSNYLRPQRAKNVVYAFVKDTKSAFRLPDDPSVPVIMIGPGTGLAPFRGFLQERAALKKQGKTVGPSHLFFGCRRPDQDFIYADELKAFEADGTTTLHVAFSRASGHPKTYVQDLVKAEAATLWELLQKGAHIYVCGDASKMAPAVRAAFIALVADRGGIPRADAEKHLDTMTAENRYCTDVWASN
jgi:cytochrome P450 / NADPH-cytochrome P450 reductase